MNKPKLWAAEIPQEVKDESNWRTYLPELRAEVAELKDQLTQSEEKANEYEEIIKEMLFEQFMSKRKL